MSLLAVGSLVFSELTPLKIRGKPFPVLRERETTGHLLYPSADKGIARSVQAAGPEV